MTEHGAGNRALSLALAGMVFLFGVHLLFLYCPAILWRGALSASVLFLIALICTSAGRMALRALGITGLSASEKTLIGCTLGVGLLSQGLFLLGAAGLLRPSAAVALLCLFWMTGFPEMRDVLRSLTANRNLFRDKPAWAALIGGLAALALLLCCVPPHQYDALVYHLALPAAYIREGRIVPAEHLVYSWFPQNGEMLFSLGLLLGSDALAQMFSWLATALSLWWVFEMGKREMPLTAALTACLLLVSHTAVMLLSSIAYVETLGMLWVAASVLSFVRWGEVSPAGGGRGWLALSAAFAGLGVGTKYYAGICPAILGTALAARWIAGSPASRKERLTDAACFSAICVLCAAPWLARNWIILGNPVFPFLYAYLPHRGVPWGAENAKRYFEALTEYGHGGRFWSDLAKFPYLVIQGSAKFGGGMDVLGNLGWGFILALTPLSIIGARRNKALRWALAYGAVHAGIWFCTGAVLRFLTVIVPLLCLPAAAGLHRCWTALGSGGRRLLVAGVSACVAVNVGLFLYTHTVLSSWDVLSGAQSREEFLSRKLDYYACARFARERLAPADKILIVGDQRSYYVSRANVATTPMAPNRFVDWANRASSPADLARALRTEGGFTHLLVVPRESKRLSAYGIFAFTEGGWRNWMGLQEHSLRREFSSDGCVLMRVL